MLAAKGGAAMKRAKQLRAYLRGLSRPPRVIFRASLYISLALLAAALLVLVLAGPFDARTYPLYNLARELAVAPAGVLLTAGVAAAWAEETMTGGK